MNDDEAKKIKASFIKYMNIKPWHSYVPPVISKHAIQHTSALLFILSQALVQHKSILY